jgi:hypothetical protein
MPDASWRAGSRPRLSLDRLSRPSSRRAPSDSLPSGGPVDRSRLFVCPTVTPLFHTASFASLDPAQALRYNQIAGLSFNELIAFFERSFAPTVLAALRGRVDPALAACLDRFLEEERGHSEMFERLNRLSAPEWYGRTDTHVVRVPPLLRRLLRFVTERPAVFPAVLWLMLAMEEHSVEVSRRCARLAPERAEPQWAAVYKAHLEDEVRHVQIDWHLVERVYERRPALVRRADALVLRAVLRRFFLPLEQGDSASRTLLFAPRGASRLVLPLARLVLGFILSRDRDVLDTLDFRGNLVASDAPLAAFIRQTNALPVFGGGVSGTGETPRALGAAGEA